MAVTGKTLTAKNFIWRRYEIPEEIILDIIELPIELKKIRIYKANGDILDFENISMASQKLNIKKEILLSFLDAKNSVDEDNTIKCVKIIN